jgi:hypothetical protein
MRTNDELSADISRLGREAGNIDAWMRSYTPGRREELSLLAEQQKQMSGALDASYAEKNLLDILKREQELKDFLQKLESQVKELQQKEAFQKADAAEKERQSSEFAARQEREKLEFLQKQDRDKQENEKQELLKKQEMQAQEAQLKEMMQKERELADANAPKQDANAPKQENLVSEIAKDTVYAVAQAADAVREAIHEIRLIREAEVREFYEQQKKQLGDYMQSDSFRKETGERKEILISEKFYEQQQAEKEKFGGRPDDFGYREQMKKDLEALHDSAFLVVKHEQEQEKLRQQLIDQLTQDAARATERVENSGCEQAAIKAELDRIAKVAEAIEQTVRDDIAKKIQAAYEKWLKSSG